MEIRRVRVIPAGVIVVALAVVAACAGPPAPPPSPLDGSLVDLSHDYSNESIFWPTADPFRLQVVAAGMTPKGYYYAANNFATSEHGGTHLDAPIHFAEGRWTVDEIPLDRLVGPAIVIDVSSAAASQADYQVSVADLTRWEQAHGRLPDDVIVLLRSDYSKRWPDAERYLGTSARGEAAVPQLHFPGLHPDAARWLIDNRQISAIGIDTASIDYGQSTLYESHRALYARNIPAFENLTNLDRVPPRGATIVALPMKIKGGSGAPLRAVAIVPAAPGT